MHPDSPFVPLPYEDGLLAFPPLNVSLSPPEATETPAISVGLSVSSAAPSAGTIAKLPSSKRTI